jgi:hypothetical protein
LTFFEVIVTPCRIQRPARSTFSEFEPRDKMQISTQWRFPDGRMPSAWTRKDRRDDVRAFGCDRDCTFSLPHAIEDVSERVPRVLLIGAVSIRLKDGPSLVEQLTKRLSRGHHKVALRAALMHYARGGEIPAAVRSAIEDAADRCTARELNLMWSDALEWARFCGTGQTAPYPFPR